MITMTWPQYQRRQCSVTAVLSPQESELLSTLLVRYPQSVPVEQLIEAVWPDPEREADYARVRVRAIIGNLGRKIGMGRIDHDGFGYCLIQNGPVSGQRT